ncbi:hypothetical protein AB0O95_07015 [Rhodoglobus sp. NPDC076762]
MQITSQRLRRRSSQPTWEKFRAEVRKIDRDSLLLEAAGATALIAKDALPEEAARQGLTPWNVADVARTALSWGGPDIRTAGSYDLRRLCNLNVNLVDEGTDAARRSNDRLARLLMRTFFEQFPGQRSIMAEVSRSLLLFGTASEHPQGFIPEAMKPGWFEGFMGGLSLDGYVEALLLIAVIAQQHSGAFSMDWLESPMFEGLEKVTSFDAVRQTFTEHLVTTVADFKLANRQHQDGVPSKQKKYAFNPLADKPFIADVAEFPIAPWGQAIISKALPPAIYHLARPALGDLFSRDLGAVFQHYVGRQLELVEGASSVLPEVQYGHRSAQIDSCDWFLELPELLVLIECKARQPIESLRIGGSDWLSSIEGSINKAIKQINRSDADIAKISASSPDIDPLKPRVGLVVTLEPFYLGQNWLMGEHLAEAELPTAVVSIADLETLVLHDADELVDVLRAAASASVNNRMAITPGFTTSEGRVNPLLDETWESIPFFQRVETVADGMRVESESSE